MLFNNSPIAIQELPQVETLQFQALEKAYLKVNHIGTVLFFVFLIVVFGVLIFTKVIDRIPLLIYSILSVWAMVFIFSIWHNWRNYKIKGYALRNHDISYRTGVFFFSITTIPFNRVQHCEIKQGPIERWFGLKTLQVFTAGGQTSDLVVPGLSPEIAQKLKSLIINKTTLVIDGYGEEE